MSLPAYCIFIPSQIPDGLVATIPDFSATDGTLFTDGCGLIRDSCAAEVCSALEISEDTTGRLLLRISHCESLALTFATQFSRSAAAESRASSCGIRMRCSTVFAGTLVVEVL